MDFLQQCLYEGVAFEDLGLDIDEMADLDGFFEWLTGEDELDGAYWDDDEECWVYPDYDEDDVDYDDDDEECWEED